MTTLITGAGLIGTSFARCALARNEPVVFFDPEPRADFIRMKLGSADVPLVRGDVRDLPALVAAIQEHRCETLVHTAGLIGGRVDEMLYSALQINIGGTINVAEAARLTGMKRLVHTSTFGVYDLRREVPKLVKEDFHRGHGRGYGNSKVAKELILEAYQRKFGFELVGIRPANVYGNGHFWSGSGGGEKIHRMVMAGIRGESARIPVNQTMVNEYVYCKDIGAALDAAATAPAPRQLFFNGGTGVLTAFDDLVAAVRRVFPGFRYEVLPGSRGRDRECRLDISAARDQLGWEPEYDLDAGLADYAEEVRRVGSP
ncbi:MAG TPA: NAD(P)-dependent oxidoreductase [Nitrospiraceae bacterium]